MAPKPAEFTSIIVQDKLSNYGMDVLKGTPPSVSHKGYISVECNLNAFYKVKNNTSAEAQIRVESEVLGYKVGGTVIVPAGGEGSFSYPLILPSDSAGRYPQPCTFRAYIPGRETEAHEVKTTVYEGWFLATHAFMYGTGPNGKNLDAFCGIDVSGKIWSSPDGHLHFFSRGTTASVTAKPDWKAAISYWIIGGTKLTDNPASFRMTYNNYAYAYICFPASRWLALEDVSLDGDVDIEDFYAVAKAYGSTPDLPNWNPLADINGDGRVDIEDVYKVAMIYGLFDQNLPTTLTVTAPAQAKVQTMTASAITFASAAAVTMILSAFLKSIVRSLRR
jgi:hypothetical protein